MDETDTPFASDTHGHKWKHQSRRVSGGELPLTEEDMHDREGTPMRRESSVRKHYRLYITTSGPFMVDAEARSHLVFTPGGIRSSSWIQTGSGTPAKTEVFPFI